MIDIDNTDPDLFWQLGKCRLQPLLASLSPLLFVAVALSVTDDATTVTYGLTQREKQNTTPLSDV